MTDKVQKIRNEVERMHNLLPIVDGDNIYLNYADRICTTLEMYIDSLQEEPISEDLEEAASRFAKEEYNRKSPVTLLYAPLMYSFKAGAKWQKAKDESTTEDLGEYLYELSKQFPEVSFAKLSRIGVRVAKWQKEHLRTDRGRTMSRAEKDLELTWKGLATIEKLGNDFVKHNQTPMSDEEFYKEILKRFKEME